jgi:Cd2+/Zn2+-exporting ATPase
MESRMQDSRPDIQATTFLIHDLCCATEEQLIRKGLRNQAGVQELEFNLVSHKLRVIHTCSEETIARQLRLIGLPGVNERAQEQTHTDPHRRLLFSTGSSAFLVALGLFGQYLSLPLAVTIALFVGSMIIGGWHIGIKAWKSVRLLALDMNFLMTIAAVGAIMIGQYAEGAAVILLFSVSLLIESYSLARTRRAIQSLLNLAPPSATVVRNGREIPARVEDVEIGETIVIRPGERIPLDGEVFEGQSRVNEAPITGESLPVLKRAGDRVFAGSFNTRGSLEVRVLKRVTDSMIARIIHLVEEAQSKKAPSQTFIEKFARYYTPSVFGLAIAIAVLPPLLLGLPFGVWIYRALVLLVIACPCALVISTPVTFVSALTNAAHQGILIKGGKHLEALAGIRSVAFDKTGTLTEGELTVTDIVPLNSLPVRELLRITAAAESRSEHHLAEALLRKAAEESLELSQLVTEGFSSITGKGIRTKVDGRTYIVGNHQLVEELGICSPVVESVLHRLENEGKTVVILSDTEKVLGAIAVADRVRNESLAAIHALYGLGIKHVVLLTGDNRGTAASVGTSLLVDDVKAELLPEDKLQAVESMRSRFGSVAMVGDGINDAPALAAADVGIAMGGIGSDTALETADVALMTDNVSRVPYAIALGQRALRIIKQNVALALLTKGVFLILGILGLSSLCLAILADDGAALIVILNGLRMLRNRPSPE